MKITKGKKTVQDYMLDGGLRGKLFSYGWSSEEGPAIYEVEGIGKKDGLGLEGTLEVIRRDERRNGEKTSLNLAIFKDNIEVFVEED